MVVGIDASAESTGKRNPGTAWQNLLPFFVGSQGGGDESYHAHRSHGADLHFDTDRHISRHRRGLRGHPSSLRRTLPNSRGYRQQQACANRCSISSCQQTPLAARLCDATAQGICSNGFRACTDACIASTATTQAIIQSQASCTTSCCTKFKLCLGQRQCELSAITVINCAETGNQ
jgi:hypothetical protein